jgi:hypothetical protein
LCLLDVVVYDGLHTADDDDSQAHKVVLQSNDHKRFWAFRAIMATDKGHTVISCGFDGSQAL